MSGDAFSEMPGEVRERTPNYVVGGPGVYTFTVAPRAICPDLLALKDLGEADGWRGKAVRAFFIVLRKVSGL